MKKTYINPTLLIVNVSTAGMIANSQPVDLKNATEHSGGGTLSGARGARFTDCDFEDE